MYSGSRALAPCSSSTTISTKSPTTPWSKKCSPRSSALPAIIPSRSHSSTTSSTSLSSMTGSGSETIRSFWKERTRSRIRSLSLRRWKLDRGWCWTCRGFRRDRFQGQRSISIQVKYAYCFVFVLVIRALVIDVNICVLDYVSPNERRRAQGYGQKGKSYMNKVIEREAKEEHKKNLPEAPKHVTDEIFVNN